MRYLSVCSGIEAATMAWHPMGWQPVAFSEIEKFPSAVLAHHYGSNMPGEPLSANGVPNLGDMTNFKEWPNYAIDILVGGTPCQSFSIAGLRRGLDDPRGNLMLTYLGIAARYRPRWLVWENVPGVLSSNGGRDFGTFIRGLEECGYHAAWRVLDSQYVRVDGFGRAVPQRRRRVFVVGYLGDWRRAAAVFFEREGLRGNSPPRRQAGEGVAGSLDAGAGVRGQPEADRGQLIVGGGPVAFDSKASQPQAIEDGSSPTLRAMNHAKSHANAGGQLAVAFNARQDPDVSGEVSHPLGSKDTGHGVLTSGAVRRLTPRECERLQAFPDDFTRIPWRGKPAEACPDGPRYKALGNSMSVNVMRWIGRRIQHVERICNSQIGGVA